MQALVQKLLDKSPNRYGLGRNLRWLAQEIFIKKDYRQDNKTQLRNCLNLLVAAKRFPGKQVDGVVDEIGNFVDEIQQGSELGAHFQAFSPPDRVDFVLFWYDK